MANKVSNNRIIAWGLVIFTLIACLVILAIYLSQRTVGPVGPSSEGGVIFGSSTGSGSFGSGSSGATEITPPNDDDPESFPRLRKLVNGPVAGAQPITRLNGSIIVRYVDGRQGDVYELDMRESEPIRLSSRKILGIHDALWSPDGRSVIIRYVDTTAGFDSVFAYSVLDVYQTSSTSSPDGTIFATGVEEISMSPFSSRAAYLQGSFDQRYLFAQNLDTTNNTYLYSPPMSEVQIQWVKDDLLALTTNASNNIDGFLYFLSPDANELDKMLSEQGLQTLVSPDGSSVLYSTHSRSKNALYLKDLSGGTTTNLALVSLPEKCTWSPVSREVIYCGVPRSFGSQPQPDAWYQGLTSFGDNIFVINTNTMTEGLVEDIYGNFGADIDIVDPSIDEGGVYLFFIDKKDRSLWSYQLKETLPTVFEMDSEPMDMEMEDATSSEGDVAS
jgi:hypothetical protein